MTTLEHFVSPALTRALGWTLLHSLWQGALVAAVLAGALLLLRRQRAEVRYVVSAGALGVVVALAGLTFGLYFGVGASRSAEPLRGASEVLATPGTTQTRTITKSVTVAAVAMSASALHTAGPLAVAPTSMAGPAAKAPMPAALIRSITQSLVYYFDRNLPLLVVMWLLGLLAMSLRMLGGLLYVQRLRRYRVRPLPAVWQERLAVLTERAGVRRPVALLESALVRVPLVVGHLRPVILLPLGTVAGLSPGYLEAILAHELAHVLRRDYLVNLLQTVAEVLFFYHPAVWFVANCVRTERENCCDDTATALVGGDPLRLALALTALAEWSQSAVVPAAPRLALAAMGRRGALLNRVRRLVQRRPAAPTLAEGLMAGALVLGGLGLLGGSVVLAGPLAAGSHPARHAAFAWQTGPTPPAKAAGTADTNKRAARVAPAPLAAPVADIPPVAPVAPAPDAASAPDATPAAPAEERRELVIERREMDDRVEMNPGHGRYREHRVILNGRDMTPLPFPGNPGTVVITKDKKGRLTDLVVNGQRVEAVTGKGKKGKGDKNQQVEIIQMVPSGEFAMRGFDFRNDGDMAQQLKRDAEREAEREIKQNHEFQFDFPDFGTQLSQNSRLEPNGRLHRTYRLNRLNGIQTPDINIDIDGRRIELDALRGAERGLHKAAAAKGLNAKQRKEINQELERVRTQLRRAESASPSSSQQPRLNSDDARRRRLDAEKRDRDVEMRNRDQAQQDRAEEMRDRQQELQERIQESQQELRELEQDRADEGRDRADHDRDQNEALNEALVNQLQKDGLIQDKNNFQLRLSARRLMVNGKEQPASVQQKYLKQYESTGRKMSATGALAISHNGNTTYNRSEGPRPPRPPRPPRAPRGLMQGPPMAPVPPAPPMQALPAPPLPPRIDSDGLRKELRKDGVIGADDKNFQFQLNASGLTVNGKKQPEALAAKYRKLTGHADGKTYNMTISTED